MLKVLFRITHMCCSLNISGQPPEEIYLLYIAGQVRPTRLYVDKLLHNPEAGPVRVMGTIAPDGRYMVTAWSHHSTPEARRHRKTQNGRLLALGIENPNVILIRVNMPGYDDVCPESELAEIMWHGVSNARDFWSEMTYGHVQFMTDLDGNGRDDIISITLAQIPTNCEDIWPAVVAKVAQDQPQFDLLRWERQVMVLPGGYTNCGFGGASIGCPVGVGCKVWLTKCKSYPDSIIRKYFANSSFHSRGINCSTQMNWDTHWVFATGVALVSRIQRSWMTTRTDPLSWDIHI
jgi:hypothetical protein